MSVRSLSERRKDLCWNEERSCMNTNCIYSVFNDVHFTLKSRFLGSLHFYFQGGKNIKPMICPLFLSGSWFGGAQLFLWRLLLAADARFTGARGLQEPVAGTPRGPTRELLHLYAGPQPGRLACGGAGGHAGSAATLSPRHLPGLRTNRIAAEEREDGNKWKNVEVGEEVFILSLTRDPILRSRLNSLRCVLISIWSYLW